MYHCNEETWVCMREREREGKKESEREFGEIIYWEQ